MTAMIFAHQYRRIQSPEQKIILKPIPGSDIIVVFNISKNVKGITSVKAKINKANKFKKKIYTIPIQSFSRYSSCSFENALKTLSEIAVDYVCGKIIFLSNVNKLIERWMEQKTANDPEAKKNPKAYVQQLENNVKELKLDRNSTKAVDAYHDFGNEYFYLGEYENALLFVQHMFLTARKINSPRWIAQAHYGFGLTYESLSEIKRAIWHCKAGIKHSQNNSLPKIGIAKFYFLMSSIHASKHEHDEALSSLKSFEENIKAELTRETELSLVDSDLGIIYLAKGEYALVEKYFEESLKNDSKNISALIGLGAIYKFQGYYKKAIEQLKTALKINSNQSDAGVIHAQLGLIYLKLGENSLALHHFEKDFAIAEDTKTCGSRARAHYHLAGYWVSHDDLEKGLKYIVDVLPFIQQVEDHQLAGMIHGLIGNFYFKSNQIDQSIKAHKKHLKLALKKRDLDGQITAHSNLGATYTYMEKFPEATNECETALTIATNAGDLEAQSRLYYNLGRNCHYMKDLDEEIRYYWLSININSKLIKENCNDNPQWQISLFETQFKPYRCLEKAILKTNTTEALKIADSSRSQALLMCLKKRLELPEEQDLDKILEIAAELKTTLVVYSCDPFNDEKAWCWVISPEKKIEFRKLNIAKSLDKEPLIENQTPLSQEGPQFEELKDEKTRGSIARWIVEVEKGSFRAPNDETQTTLPYELDQLKKWYADFIPPIIDLIPKNGERITFIPDAFLHEAPFALFLDGNGKFLFETCTPSVAPSIETLLHINQLNKKNSSSRTRGTLCMVASPKPHEDFALDELPGVATEKVFTTKFFESSPEVTPVVKEVKKSLCQAGNIHIASHGKSKAKENEHSVFEGALALTDPLPLYAEDVVHLPLNAELAFLSACSSGNGKKFKEGSIGLPFAFLAGGASSVIATRWNINDVATPKIVENFYQHYFGLSKEAQIARFENKPFGQAEALRHAMLFGKKTYSDRPKVWGAFFLNGLPGNIFQHDPVPDDKHPKPIIWENQDQRLLFSLKGETIITTLINKKSGDRSDFEEKNVIVCMKNTVQVKGTIQDKRPLDELQLAEKQQVINFLVFRVIVIEGKNICITSRLRS